MSEKSSTRWRRLAPRALASSLVLAVAPLLGGAEGGCGPAFARDPAPDMSGGWTITYDDTFSVKVTIGAGAARREYTRTLSATGGTFQVPLTPDGAEQLTFELDCTRPEVVCPSEVWPTMPSIRQDHPDYTHRIFLQIPTQECMGNMVSPEDDACGPGTLNPDCEMVCDSDVSTVVREAFGTIRDDEQGFDILLGAGVATNGVNCAMLSLSVASGELETTGSAAAENWRATGITNGRVTTGYAGGCLWATDVGTPADPDVRAVVIGAAIEFSTGYTGTR
ncbi:MAG: hypothetical protein IPL19_10705 [Sandaracinaceae bacterium]|nr:hypothetical protein [Sandaracinaceae bacterium]MBK8593595.1 hypothetical protein [Sandaracinaceae bacterium]